MSISITRLREDLYRLADEVLETGKPLEIRRKGRKLLLVPEVPASKLGRLKKRGSLTGDPEEIVHLDWSKEWRP
ncbi:MAG: type II toxin-antitoxin system Phd/YefM family antitoxin [Puniceicoccaceae bacterium]